MPKIYSHDFKLSLTRLYQHNLLNMTEIAELYNISRKSLYNWNKNIFVKQKQYKNYKRKITATTTKFILDYVIKKTLFIMPKLLNKIKRNFNISMSKSSVYKILKDNDITYKKINVVKKIKKVNNKGKITNWLKDIQKKKEGLIISINESSIVVNDSPNYGWRKKGDKTIIKTDKKNTVVKKHLLMAISNKKVIGYTIYDKRIESNAFIDFLKQKINKKYKRSKLLLDNARIHHSKKVKSYVNNNRLIYTIPYSPELNPIKNVFALIKHNLRRMFKSCLSINQKIEKIVNSKIDDKKLKGYFENSFYR